MKFFALCAASIIVLAIPTQAQEKPSAAAPAKTGPKIVQVTPDDAQKLIAEGVTVVDLRTEEEFEHTHIRGAKNVNALDPEFEKNIAALDASKPILVHCQSGSRSRTAIETVLSKSKFPAVYHLSEGLTAWKKAGKPLDLTPTPEQSGKLPERLK
ncbi:MAG: hypothetical protein RL088_1230 [Verrucomicrobiota bacterium]|jgi:rhodanese-related sulfurtransferase